MSKLRPPTATPFPILWRTRQQRCVVGVISGLIHTPRPSFERVDFSPHYPMLYALRSVGQHVGLRLSCVAKAKSKLYHCINAILVWRQL